MLYFAQDLAPVRAVQVTTLLTSRAHTSKVRDYLSLDIAPLAYEIDLSQIRTSLELLNDSLRCINFASSKLEQPLDQLFQFTFIALVHLPDEKITDVSTRCLERMLKVIIKKDFVKVNKVGLLSSHCYTSLR